MNRIGERIKRNREKLNMPLSDLSKKVGISVSALSQIENAKAFPSIITLKTIAESLFTTVGELVGENETLTKNPLIKASDLKFVKKNESGTKLYLLSHHDNSKQMEPFLLTFVKDSDTNGIMSEHSGQGFIRALSGKFRATLGDKEHMLEEGDNFYYNTNIPLLIRNTGNTAANALWIITPPFV